MTRSRAVCARCGRTIPLTVQGLLFLHTDRGYRAGPPAEFGDHCPGGMTRDCEPGAPAAVRAMA